MSNKPAVVSLLKVQYRMHEEIMKFPSQWFYNGELEAAPEVRYRGILDWDTPSTGLTPPKWISKKNLWERLSGALIRRKRTCSYQN